jgi:hypothetical protein
MSPLGQSEKSGRLTGRSALLPTPDMALHREKRRFVPIAEIAVAAQSIKSLVTQDGTPLHSGSPALRRPPIYN